MNSISTKLAVSQSITPEPHFAETECDPVSGVSPKYEIVLFVLLPGTSNGASIEKVFRIVDRQIRNCPDAIQDAHNKPRHGVHHQEQRQTLVYKS